MKASTTPLRKSEISLDKAYSNGHIITWCCDVRFLKNKTMMQPTTFTKVTARDRQSAADSSWTWRWHLNFRSVFVNLSSCNENEDVYDV